MASAGGRKGPAVIDVLLAEAYRFDFFQAVHLLQRYADERAQAEPPARLHPVGHDRHPAREAIRFRALPSLSFPPSPIARVDAAPDGQPAEDQPPKPPSMMVSFMGLTGPAGVLPRHYTRLLLERIREKDHTAQDFFDLFNHRAISLFYRTWEKYRFPIGYERSQANESGEDLFTNCLYSIVGLGLPELRDRFDFDDEVTLYYAGLFAHDGRNAVSLERMLEDYFELPVRLEQFQGQWLYLSEDDRSQMPSARDPDGKNNQMGLNLVMGERVWDVQCKVRIRMGPLRYEQFRRFTPTGDSLRRLLEMARFYCGPEFDFDVQPVLRAADVPWFQFGADPDQGPRLGWNTWIRSRPFARDVDDAVFFLEHV